MQNHIDEQHLAREKGSKIIDSMDHEFHDASDRVIAIVGVAYLGGKLGSGLEI
ncbi:MAG: hypothetical protein HZA10_01835 [Nitrospirae bacterium]|nr:hypothetical protein [Nitrospirota bacterium]